jgi:hypothetical protein
MKKLLFISSIVLTIHANAQWVSTGGPSSGGQNVSAVAATDIALFAGKATGSSTSPIYYSANNGTAWSTVGTGLTGSGIGAVAFSGTNIFAGVGTSVYFSANNGTNWTSVSSGLPSYNINSLVVSGSTIYAGLFGIYSSTNNGLSWSQLNSTWNGTVNSIAVSGNTILAGTTAGGIYMSTNSGSTWSAINTGLPTQIAAVAIVGTTFLAGTPSGLYISTNNGVSWTVTNVTSGINAFAISGSNIFAGSNGSGVYVSSNNGTSWTATNTGLTDLDILSLATNSTYLFAGGSTSGVVWRIGLSTFSTGIQQIANSNDLNIYPNPTSSIINVELKMKDGIQNTTLQITDALGNTVKQSIIYNSQSLIDVSDLSEGVYNILIQNSETRINKRLVVVH